MGTRNEVGDARSGMPQYEQEQPTPLVFIVGRHKMLHVQ